MSLQRPKAIIVGGGPVGLTAALGLTRANIDFVVLEQRKDVVIEEGSDMTLIPMTMPALEQLDLIEPLSKIWHPVSQIGRIDHNGRRMGDLQIFKYLKESTGWYPYVVSRHDLLATLWDALPESAHHKIFTGKKLSQIRTTSDGVTVSCKDGTSYEGTFVIGADGAYSATRKAMRNMAQEAGSPDVNDANPFLATYQALWIRFPTASLPGCENGTATESHGHEFATQLFAGKEYSTVGVYRRLPTPTATPPRYNEKDQDALVEECGDMRLLKGSDACLRDAYNARVGSGLVSLEEGVVPHWSYNGRVVLVGDAAHKFTPSNGSGLNHGMIDTVALVNELHDLSKKHSNASQPWWHESTLSEAFKKYQQRRQEDVTVGCDQSSGATAMATWTNIGLKLVDQYLLPTSLAQWWFGRRIAARARSTKPVTFEFN